MHAAEDETLHLEDTTWSFSLFGVFFWCLLSLLLELLEEFSLDLNSLLCYFLLLQTTTIILLTTIIRNHPSATIPMSIQTTQYGTNRHNHLHPKEGILIEK